MPPQNSIVFELVHHHLNTLFRAGASDFVAAVSARRTIYESDMRAKISLLRVGHFVPRWWDILSQGGGTFCPKVVGHFVPRWHYHPKSSHYMHAMQKPPLYVYYLYIYFLNGGCSIAAPPHPPLAMPPCGGVRTSLRSGYSGGLSPTPQTPQRRPQRALAQGLMPSLRSGYQLLRAITLFGFDSIARRWCSLASLAALQCGDVISALWPRVRGLSFRVLENGLSK